MLLLLHRINRLRRPLRLPHARFLTTLPKPIPAYVPQYDPTRHTPQSTILVAPQDAAHNDVRRTERAQLRHSRGYEVFPSDTHPLDLRHKCIRELYDRLRLADTRPDSLVSGLKLWHAYSETKKIFPGVTVAMPDKAWDLLWKTQEQASHPNRTRLQQLRRDMFDCGRYEAVGLRVHYLNGLFLNGHEDFAIREWEEDHQGTNNLPRHDYKPEHLELGARMYALSGNPDRAREIMEELFDLYPCWNPSVMKVVFRAHTDTTSTHHHDLAKKIYIELKQRLDTNLRLHDYDACFVGFLEARHLNYAKMVFRDMIKDGYLATSSSPAAVEEVLRRLHKLFLLGTDISKMTSIGLQAITALPRAYHSHVFSHWMRAAVIRRAPEAAAQLIDVMFNHGLRPRSDHFNLLLKAFMQSKDEVHVLKAENIGWQMINEARKASLEQLPHWDASTFISQWVDDRQDAAPDTGTVRTVAKANVTTFAIIAQHHASKLQWEHVDYLARQLNENGLQPNTEFMNIMMDNKCRQGKFGEAWKIYRSLTEVPEGVPGVFPDGASIRCLWKTLRLALGNEATRHDPVLPRPRELLAETVDWWARCQSRPDAERFKIGLAAKRHGALTTLMMHCFSYTDDLAGSLVGLHVLRQTFGIFPVDSCAETLQKHVAWVDLSQKAQHERTHFSQAGSFGENFKKLGRVYYILMERRWQEMGLTEEKYAEFSDEEIGDMGLNLLSEFIRVIMKRSHPPEVVEAMINQAKAEVGVPDMSTGDMDAFNVA